MTHIKVAFAAVTSIFSLAAYLYFVEPTALVVDQSGEINGLQNEIRASLNGEKFWGNQLRIAKWKLKEEIERPAMIAGMMNDMKVRDAKLSKLIYSHLPEEERSARIRADELRDQADEIEAEASDKKIEELLREGRLRRIAELRKTVRVIQLKSTVTDL